MGVPPIGLSFPLGTTPFNNLPLQVLDVQTLLVSAPAFPREFFFPAVPDIICIARVPGYGGSDVISLQFNGDTGANYWDNTLTTAAVAASGTTAPANSEVATINTTLLRMGLPINKWRLVIAQILNDANREKGVSMCVNIGSATPPGNTNQGHLSASGGWDGAAPTQQICRVKVLTAGGLNMLAGTKVWFLALG